MKSITPDEAIQMKKRYLMSSIPSYYREPLCLERGEMQYLLGKRFEERLLLLKDKYPEFIGHVRVKGLMVGVEIIKEGKEPNGVSARALVQLCKDRGLLIGLGGSHLHVLRMGPPLVISEDDIEMASRVLDESFDALKKEVI